MSLKNETGETIVVSLSALFIIGWVSVAAWFFITNVNFKRASKSPANPSTQAKPGTVAAQPNQAATATSAPQPNQPPAVASFAQVPNVPSGEFTYSGSALWEPIRQAAYPAIQTAWKPFQLRYTQPVSGKLDSDTGINMLLNNNLAFTLSSRALKVEEQQEATKSGFTLKEVPVASDGIAVAVHPSLKIPGLTVAQLKDIYLGKVMNWKEVGGPDILITVYSGRKGDGGLIDFFVANVLSKENFGANIQFVPSSREALQTVASNTGGIYFASAPEVIRRCDVKALPIGVQANALVAPYKEPLVPIEQCLVPRNQQPKRNQVNPEVFKTAQYPLSRQLSVIVKQNGKEDQRAGEAYSQLLLTNQGQDLITNTGLIGVR